MWGALKGLASCQLHKSEVCLVLLRFAEKRGVMSFCFLFSFGGWRCSQPGAINLRNSNMFEKTQGKPNLLPDMNFKAPHIVKIHWADFNASIPKIIFLQSNEGTVNKSGTIEHHNKPPKEQPTSSKKRKEPSNQAWRGRQQENTHKKVTSVGPFALSFYAGRKPRVQDPSFRAEQKRVANSPAPAQRARGQQDMGFIGKGFGFFPQIAERF